MLTTIDQIANQNHLQLFKAAIPYLPENRQSFLSCYIKMVELQNVASFFSNSHGRLQSCAVGQEAPNLTDMISDLRNFCDESEQKWLDQMSNVLTAMELYAAMAENFDSEEEYE